MITDMMIQNNSTTFWVISIDSTRRKIYQVFVILLLQRTSHTSPKQRLKTGDDVVNVYINQEKKLAFVEMRSVEEASNAMALDGIIFEDLSVTDITCVALNGIKMGDKTLTDRRANHGQTQSKAGECTVTCTTTNCAAEMSNVFSAR
ncbi:splicing factor U2af large subunit B isoform X2 [Tanacetum coccineum]